MENRLFGSPKEREAVLKDCPFLKTFLSRDKMEASAWLNQSEIEAHALTKIIESHLGEEWEQRILFPLIILTQSVGLIDRKLKPEMIAGTIKSVFLFGYELGDEERKRNYFLQDIAVQLGHMKLLDPIFLQSEHGPEVMTDSILGIIKAGCFMRGLLDLDRKLGSESPFPGFIDSLDL